MARCLFGANHLKSLSNGRHQFENQETPWTAVCGVFLRQCLLLRRWSIALAYLIFPFGGPVDRKHCGKHICVREIPYPILLPPDRYVDRSI